MFGGSKRKLSPIVSAKEDSRTKKQRGEKTTFRDGEDLTACTSGSVPEYTSMNFHDSEMKLSSPSKEALKDSSSVLGCLGDFGKSGSMIGMRSPVHQRFSRGGISAKQQNSRPARIVIREFSVKPSLPVDFEDRTWEKLRRAIWAVHAKESIEYSLEELYKDVENLCTHGMAARLHSRLSDELEVLIRTMKILGLCANLVLGGDLERLLIRTDDANVFLSLVNTCWLDHCRQMTMILNIFLVLNQTYAKQSTRVRSIWSVGLDLFRRNILSHSEVGSKLTKSLLDVIARDRRGDSVDITVLRSLLDMLRMAGLYRKSFEGPFVSSSEMFYQQAGDSYVSQLEVPDYLVYAESRIQDERDRLNRYIAPQSAKLLMSVVEQQLLARHFDSLIDRGVKQLLSSVSVEHLHRFYAMGRRVDALPKIRAAFGQYVRGAGLAIVSDGDRQSTMIEDLLEFKRQLDFVLKNAFELNTAFRDVIRDSFEHFLNTQHNKPAELIAKFVDSKLRSGVKGVTEDEIEALLDETMALFRYIQGKDVFEAFYKKDLAKRLLLGKSASVDSEKSMITKLKAECGPNFTLKLEGMFKDMDLSKDIMSSFRSSIRTTENPPSIDVSVNVLTQGYWPPYPPCEIVLPPYMSSLQELFRSFYLSKHSGRKLSFQHTLGHLVVKVQFPKGAKDLVVSLFQSIVLLLFNNVPADGSLTFCQIQAQTEIEEKELKRVLQSLACVKKMRVLLKTPTGREVDTEDSFSVNDDFAHPLCRIRVNTIQIKETPEEQKQTTEKVFQDRQYQVDAAIVRTMKTRKQLSHQLLMTELYNQLDFAFSSADIKKRIESLIERDYLERDPSSAGLYNYLA